VEPSAIVVKLDDDGGGWGVMSILRTWGLTVVPIGAGTAALEFANYPNRRSELWFSTARLAKVGGLDLHRLPREVRERIKVQCMAPVWTPDNKGRRVVEPKLKTKEKIHRSPDDADAMNLAFCSTVATELRLVAAEPEQQEPDHGGEWRRMSHAEERGLLGRGYGPQRHHHHRGFLGR
jgi:hypothetical protein